MEFGLSIDDFGTGYSSLTCLNRFPLGRIKVDKSFVQEIGSSADAEAIVRAVIGLGHSLGKTVTAEGVETAEQFAFLREYDCDEAQGFLISRPLGTARLYDLLAAQQPEGAAATAGMDLALKTGASVQGPVDAIGAQGDGFHGSAPQWTASAHLSPKD